MLTKNAYDLYKVVQLALQRCCGLASGGFISTKVFQTNFSKSKVLVAEDDETSQFIISHMLQALGYQSLVVENGIKAIEILRKSQFDVVLMDCRMPELDGYEATKRIRSSTGLPNEIPVIALTGTVDEADIQRCIDSGMNAFISKPIDKQKLELTLKRFVN